MGYLDQSPWTLLPDGTAKQFGIDHGETRTRPIRVLAKNEQLVVMKMPSSMCWSGIMMPRTYHPSRMVVYRVTSKKGDKYLLETLIEW